MNGWSQFAQRHWIIGGILASLLWFLAGRQSLLNRQPGYGMFWQGIAVFIAAVLCVWAILDMEWAGLALGILVLCFEASWMKRAYTRRDGER